MGKKRQQPNVGDKYNHLTVIKRLENYISPRGINFSVWLCRCDCGTELSVLGSSLTTGHTKSCGCLSRQAKVSDDAMLGQKFGMLTVLERAPSHKIPSGSVYDRWHCVCDCGRETVSLGRNLRKGSTQSCGCERVRRQAAAKHTPKAETWTKQYLEECDVRYDYQKTFSDLLSPSRYPLSYDFFLPDFKILIELNGLQHYQAVDWFGGEDTLQKQLLFDKMKRDYADNNGYTLIVIDTDHITRANLISKLNSVLDAVIKS